MTRVRIGIPVRERSDLVVSTVEDLEAASDRLDIVLLIDGADPTTRAALSRERVAQVLTWNDARGVATCFNRLIGSGQADVYVLLENGARVGAGWLQHLLTGLAANPCHGLAGPSTNRCWNEQCALTDGDGSVQDGSVQHIERAARLTAQRFGDTLAYLEPLHSLAEFCYAVKREVIEAVGAADEGYGLGPCWEMDYNIRAARAGFRGVWVRGAYVWRTAPPSWRRAEEAAWLAFAKQRYQNRFCGLRLRGEKQDFEPHCKGEDCPHFAPIGEISLRIPLAEQTGDEPSKGLSGKDLPARPEPSVNEQLPPLVSCLMPTCNRRRFVSAAIDAFLRQNYARRELVILDDGDDPVVDLVPRDSRIRYVREARGLSLGAKRNLACSLAEGEIFLHWDDDDWHAPWRLSYQVRELLAHRADLCGLDRIKFYDPAADRAWQYRCPSGRMHWVYGGTFCYHRALWERHRFADITIGEDTRFVREVGFARVVALPRDDFYVARVHTGNTSVKHTNGSNWHAIPVEDVKRLLSSGFDVGVGDCGGQTAPSATAKRELPLVSCIMPTKDRPDWVAQAITYFLRQDYPKRELIIIDDGPNNVALTFPAEAPIRYVHLSQTLSIGAKRNRACHLAGGSVIAQWDDDDWYGPQRLSRQVAPIIADDADITALFGTCFFDIDRWMFWRCSENLHRRLFFMDVHGGTLVFRRRLFGEVARYPDRSLAEDAQFLRTAVGRGARLARLPGDGLFLYVRHGRNSWQLSCGEEAGGRDWQRIAEPEMPADDRSFYRKRTSDKATGQRPITADIPRTLRGSMVLLTGFYTDEDPARKQELLECLRRNGENTLIHEVHVFLEDPAAERAVATACVESSKLKIRMVQHGRRLSFQDLFEYANRNLAGRRILLANSDIFFDSSLDLLRSRDLCGQLLCLSRWDIQPDGCSMFFENPSSQDAWIFDAPIRRFRSDFHLGLPGCDNRLAWEAKQVGLSLANPGRSVRANHLHLIRIHRYSATDRLAGPGLELAAFRLSTAHIRFRESMGYTLERLRPGVSSHNNDRRPFLKIPAELLERVFTQVVSCCVSPVEVCFLTSGSIYVLVGTDWEGSKCASAWLRDVAFRQPIPPVQTRRRTSFDVWSLSGMPGEAFTIPTQVMLVADDIVRA